MTRQQQVTSHAKVATTEQLCHWIQQLKARALTEITAERLDIFLAELVARSRSAS